MVLPVECYTLWSTDPDKGFSVLLEQKKIPTKNTGRYGKCYWNELVK